LVTLLVPVSAMLLGRLVLDEPITLRALAGMALIGTGLAAIDGRIIPVVFRRDR
jgi:drug/metabolite transporter (DMT)-like permease